MDGIYFCVVCEKSCQSITNYDAHVRGKEHQRKLPMHKPTISNPAQQVFIDMDYDDDEYEPVAGLQTMQQSRIQESPTANKTV